MQTHSRRWWSTEIPNLTIGIDVGDTTSVLCHLERNGSVVSRTKLSSTEAAFRKYFSRLPSCRLVLEVGTHSPWMSRLLDELGHEVIVANAGRMRKKGRKNDALDAEYLARQGRADPALLYPIRHRGEEAQAALVAITSRDVLVRSRAQMINYVRGVVKSLGGRIPKCSAEVFARVAAQHVPQILTAQLESVLKMLTELTARIRAADKEIERLCGEEYPETARLRQISGVGPITALSYVLVLEDPKRFRRSRSVGAYLGLVPDLSESGTVKRQLPISKEGDRLLRRLLVQAAHYVIGPHGPDTDLRRWGLALVERGGGGRGKKRAVVAVARKLAVLLHHLWSTAEMYEPLREAKEPRAA